MSDVHCVLPVGGIQGVGGGCFYPSVARADSSVGSLSVDWDSWDPWDVGGFGDFGGLGDVVGVVGDVVGFGGFFLGFVVLFLVAVFDGVVGSSVGFLGFEVDTFGHLNVGNVCEDDDRDY